MSLIEWPSGKEPNQDYVCDWCESMPTEQHQPDCPLAGPEIYADDLQWCPACGCTYATNCPCSSEDDR